MTRSAVRRDECPPVAHDLTIVIPTLGRPLLERCLASIAAGTRWPAQLIVVDQSSSASVAAMLETLRTEGIDAVHVPSTQRGRAAAVNRGLERVRTRFAALTDDDCRVDPSWVEHMAAALRSAPDRVVTGRVEPEGNEAVMALSTSPNPMLYRRPMLKADPLCGGNMGVAVAVLESVGLFDEDPSVRTAEDCEWSYRALHGGVQIAYAPHIVVHHYGWRDASQREAQYRSYARSHGGFYGKYLRRGDLFIACRTLIHLLRSARRWVVGALTADAERARDGRAYLLGLLPGIAAGLRRSRA